MNTQNTAAPDENTAAPTSAPDDGETLALSQAQRDYEDKPPADAGQAAGAKQQGDPFFLPAPELPTQLGPRGIRFDFNDGARVFLPPGADRKSVV